MQKLPVNYLEKRRMQLKVLFNDSIFLINSEKGFFLKVGGLDVAIPRYLDLMIVNVEITSRQSVLSISKITFQLLRQMLMKWSTFLSWKGTKRAKELVNWWELIKVFPGYNLRRGTLSLRFVDQFFQFYCNIFLSNFAAISSYDFDKRLWWSWQKLIGGILN